MKGNHFSSLMPRKMGYFPTVLDDNSWFNYCPCASNSASCRVLRPANHLFEPGKFWDFFLYFLHFLVTNGLQPTVLILVIIPDLTIVYVHQTKHLCQVLRPACHLFEPRKFWDIFLYSLHFLCQQFAASFQQPAVLNPFSPNNDQY